MGRCYGGDGMGFESCVSGCGWYKSGIMNILVWFEYVSVFVIQGSLGNGLLVVL